MSELGEPRVMAVVVSWNPDPALLTRQFAALGPQIAKLIVVDNASSPAVQSIIAAAVADCGGEYHPQEENTGLAAAQVHGIGRALILGASHVLLLDQDSLPAADMIARLLTALSDLAGRGFPVAAVGPRLIAARDGGSSPWVRFHWWGVEKIPAGDALTPPYTASDFLIASGLLAPASVYETVGLPEAGLFIDNVDMEWSFRARARGFRLYGVNAAVLTHRLGERTAYLPGLRRLGAIHIHGPLRQYYQIRNRLRLYSRRYCPWAWKLQDFPRALFKLFYFSCVVPPRGRNARMMALAVWDALRGVSGRCPYE
ncbi:MAG: glycosyltransferase family 2 protein [Gammaproteobacteria bacterium]|nr:glycosyltransferase family 2 protein [Gammaproteobacteria bacterium]MCP5425757.1 glycosyltransferase family 2 protein [Gammaproteobacteria bacterium]MCP5458632.1 glycosyltransferase family 2 protein [Gammaproteobacteria bacterium]